MSYLFLLIILIALVPMFLMTRKQKKAMQKTAEMQDALKVGDRVMTSAGLHATIVDLSDKTVDLEIADGVVTTWEKIVVRELLGDDESAAEYDADYEEDEYDDAEYDESDYDAEDAHEDDAPVTSSVEGRSAAAEAPSAARGAAAGGRASD